MVDISLKSGNGIDLVRRLRARYPDLRILVWSMYTENLYAERALSAGATGDAIHAVMSGKILNDKEDKK